MQKRDIAHYCYPLLILVLGIALFFTALPRVRAALNQLPVDLAISELNKRHGLEPNKVDILITKAQQSIAFSDQPRYWADLSQLLFFQAGKITANPKQRQALLTQAQDSTEQSLARSPANSLLWFQFAWQQILLNKVSDKTIKALNLSIMTGPNELGHLLPRLQLCLFVFSKFDPKDRFLLPNQILIAWQKAPKIFIKEIALKNGNMFKIRSLLYDKYSYVLAAMETEIEKTH